ncbi:hypothetical protein EVJ58_g2666 [Rhodofomes roseus]|uniref:Uncharacterized protein n=1 Tax=Rhodofomes roseus TaxID=34475 RepID=A0A4Y9YQG5_9APHY|nr:hypothetical protein EVJ58_g2666 [Rhodofomes roseus]
MAVSVSVLAVTPRLVAFPVAIIAMPMLAVAVTVPGKVVAVAVAVCERVEGKGVDAYPVPSGAPPAAYNASQAEEQKREYGEALGMELELEGRAQVLAVAAACAGGTDCCCSGPAPGSACPSPSDADRPLGGGPPPCAGTRKASHRYCKSTVFVKATLDSVLATVQSLKVKLAEARAQREQHLQQMQALKDEQYKMFEQWRKQHEEQQKQQQQAAQQQPPKPRYPVDFTSA